MWNFKNWILYSLFFVVLYPAKAGKEPEVKQVLPRSGVSFAVNNSALVYDAVLLNSAGLPTGIPPNSYKLFNVKNMVYLDIDQSQINHFFLTQFSVTVNVEITSKNEFGVPNPTQNISLTVDYDTATLYRYTEKNSFTFQNAYWVNAKITGISNPAATPYIRLNNSMTVERYKNIAMTIPTFNTGNWNTTTDQIEVIWNPIVGAEEYDLEWTFIDDYNSTDVNAGGSYINPFLSINNIAYSFKNNATRVTVKGTSFKISNLFEHGYIIFRVRGVGYTGALYSHRVEGLWSSQNYGPLLQNSSGSSFTLSKDLFHCVHNATSAGQVKVHEKTFNWQTQTIFAEEGKNKSAVGYYDGALKNRQNVTRISTDEMAIAGEDIYDFQGRKVGSFLPVPTFENKLKFYSNFNISATSGKPYDETDFDVTSSYCNRSIGLVSNSSGAGKYYSLNNPLAANIHQEYIPDAQQFPFVLTEFTPDATGRVRRQGGVGPDHQLGTGHETQYFYGTPDQEELDRLFGNAVGYAAHYQKNMVIDPNGQISISYLDLQGRIVATALSGENPGNVQALPNKGMVSNLQVSIKINKQSDLFDNYIQTSKTIIVGQPGNYEIDYQLQIPRLTDASTPNMCFDCVYQMDIQLINDCGVNVLDGDINTTGIQLLSRTVGKPNANEFDVTCETNLIEYTFISDGSLGNAPIIAPLQVGTYTLVKTLKIDEAALEYYTQQYLSAKNNLRTFEDFKNEYEDSTDFGQCAVTCSECLEKLGTYSTFLNKRIQNLISLEGTPSNGDTLAILATWNAIDNHCEALCNNANTQRCQDILELLKTDISPGGQYAKIASDGSLGGLLETNLSNIAFLGFNYQFHWETSGNINDRQPIVYQDANNQPIYFYINGIKKTPNELTPEEFEDQFNDALASVLVKYHPEYCKYLQCTSNQLAEDYEQNMLKTETYAEALAAGYMNPVNESTSPCASNILDPWFQSGGNGSSKLQDMKDLLKAYQNIDPTDINCTTLSLWNLCQVYFICGGKSNCNQINSCLTNNSWGSLTCQPYLDQMWRMFRSIYLAERRKMMEAQLSSNCPRTSSISNNNIERLPKLSNISGNYSQNNRGVIYAEQKQRLLNECDTSCMAKAQGWYVQFKDCNLSAADSAELISNFVKVCRNACDENHPQGASSSPKNRTQRFATPFYSFLDVFNYMVSQGKITPSPGNCDINNITEMPYGHNFTYKNLAEGDTLCIKNYNYLDPCVKNAPSYELKKTYQYTNPPEDSILCDKCIKCSDLKDALLQIQSEYGVPLTDSTMGWRKAITNRLNQILQFNLYWQDYWEFMENCSELDSNFTLSVINHFMIYYTGVDIEERMFKYEKLLKDHPHQPVPSKQFYLASANASLTVPTSDSTLLSSCICNKLATFKASWLNNNNGYPTFNEYMANQCGFTPPQFYNFDMVLNTCQEFYNLRGKNNSLPAVWSNNQKRTFDNFILKKNYYVPKLCTWDCVDTPMTEKNPFLNKGKYGNTNNPPSGYTPNTKPTWRKGVTCDSFYYILDSMQSVLGGSINLRSILRMYPFSNNTLGIQSHLTQFISVKNAFYSKYPTAFQDPRFGSDPLKSLLAWLQSYKNCLFDQLGYDSEGFACCQKPNRYARALNGLLNKLSEPIDQYGNYLIEDQWNMHPPIPEFYNSVLYNGSNKTTIKYIHNPYDLPKLVMEMDDQNGVKKTVQLNYIDNLWNEAYFGDIVAFLNIQPVRMNTPCDTAHYFKVKVIQKVSWGYDTTWLTGYAPQWNLMDTCDRSSQIELCDKNYYEAPWVVDTLTCQERIAALVNFHAQKAYDEYINNIKNDFRKKYYDKCLDPFLNETFTIIKPMLEYHYTLYYFDQAGNLLQTVPPAGVSPLSNSQLAAVQTARVNNTAGTFPTHSLNTRYKYNTLNQLVWQKTPDAGEGQFWYDNVGRLVVSQNAKQALLGYYSYTHFDALGRITEVGQLENISGGGPTVMTKAIAFNPTQLAAFIASGQHKQVTKSYYDETVTGFSFIPQKNLRKRVSGMEYFDDGAGSVVSGVYYTYDIHGNVTTLVRRNEVLSGIGKNYTRVDYDFDLVSGKVNRLDYQKNQSDWFIHQYEYDADNRITDVFTSVDNTFFDRDASYFYYLHGPLKRTELGELKVQGLDFVYTIHGWIKGVNSTTLQALRDPGRDGLGGTMHQNVCRDVAGYNLGYYEGEYKAIGSGVGGTLAQANYFTPVVASTPLDNASPSLYNGNIRHMITALKPFMYNKSTGIWSSPQAMAYTYDQLNRIKGAQALIGSNTQGTNTWSGATNKVEYLESYSYDPNGNILTLNRNGSNPLIPLMDQMTYHYKPGTNQLDYVTDAVASANYSVDIDNQAPSNYDYDAIGNLIKDQLEEIASIQWTVYGKISKVIRTPISTKPDLEFIYSPDGQRIAKKVIGKGVNGVTTYTFYSLDAQGNHLATYTLRRDSLVWESSVIYGSTRVGIYEAQKLIVQNGLPVIPTLAPGYHVLERGIRRYEIANHLGNVLTTISDRREMVVTGTGVIINYEAEIVSASDYYPFGMVMEARNFSVQEKYRYGFNTQEKEPELGEGITSAEFWIYDGKLGRRWNVDPKLNISLSPYSCFSNNPIYFSDLLGDTVIGSNGKAVTYEKTKDGTIKWSSNATSDIIEVGNAMLSTDFGEQAFIKWQKAKTLVNIEIDRELAPEEYYATTEPTKDKKGQPIINSENQYDNIKVKFYKKKIDKIIEAGNKNRFENSSYEEALGAIGTHEVYHNEPAQINLDFATSEELKQDPKKNLPINAEVNFRREYHKKHPDLPNSETWENNYKIRGYEGIPN